MLRHSDIGTTVNIYIHLSFGDKQKSTNAILMCLVNDNQNGRKKQRAREVNKIKNPKPLF